MDRSRPPSRPRGSSKRAANNYFHDVPSLPDHPNSQSSNNANVSENNGRQNADNNTRLTGKTTQDNVDCSSDLYSYRRNRLNINQKQNKRRVTKDDWPTNPFDLPRTAPWIVDLPEDAPTRLLQGFRPVESEDEWFVYGEGPDDAGMATVYFFRAWTGNPLAEVRLEVASPSSIVSPRIPSPSFAKDSRHGDGTASNSPFPSTKHVRSQSSSAVLQPCQRLAGSGGRFLEMKWEAGSGRFGNTSASMAQDKVIRACASVFGLTIMRSTPRFEREGDFECRPQ